MMYFFDMDGTILDSNGVWTQIDVDFLGRFGVDPVPEDYTDYVTHHNYPQAARYTKERYHLELTAQEIMDIWQDMAEEAYAGRLALKPGVRDFLERARAAGIRCALLTSCYPTLCALALEAHGLTGYFERVFTTVELDMEKRDPELFHTVSALCGEKEEDCLLFEDSPVNCAAARAAGWQVLGVADPLFAPQAAEMERICGKKRWPFSFLSPLPDSTIFQKT